LCYEEAGLATGFFSSSICVLDESTAIQKHYFDYLLNPILAPLDLLATSQFSEGLPATFQGLP
jgi:hypothetical protein